jgi:U3 small nucleolar RNA-associated protein MPP10
MENESNGISIVDELLIQSGKLNLIKNQKKVCNLLEELLAELTGSEIKVQNIDQHQIWALIEKYGNNIVKNYKEITIDSDSLNKTLNKDFRNIKQEFKMLQNKRPRNDEGNEEAEEAEVGDEIDEEGLNNEEDNGEQFFDMDEFNNIGDDLDGDNEEPENDEEFEEDDDNGDNNDKDYKYKDFFDAPAKKKIDAQKDDLDDEEIENNLFDIEDKIIKNDTEGIEDTYRFINQNVTESIENIEQKMIGAKKWHMKGEVTSKQRPKNSLLENYLDFQVSIKPPPIPTEDYTNTTEKLIKLRIRDELFDDPIRKDTINLNKKSGGIELNFEKSQKGLGELYEEDYSKNVMKIVPEGQEAAVKLEIDGLCTKLYNIFDKLTNNNFVSGVRNTDMKVVTNIPSIQLEEISQFVTENTKGALSSNELYSRKDMETKTKDEFTVQDNKASHKKWKRNVRNKLHQKEKTKKLNNLGKLYDSKFEARVALKQEKDKAKKKNIKNSELKSSKFFGNLQNIVSDDISKKNTKHSKLLEMNSWKSAKQFKL